MLLKNVQTLAHWGGMFPLHVSIFQKLLGRNASSSISFGLCLVGETVCKVLENSLSKYVM
jgi:hypothetical protein